MKLYTYGFWHGVRSKQGMALYLDVMHIYSTGNVVQAQ